MASGSSTTIHDRISVHDSDEVIILAVERSMKKHTDNIMRFLEGLSSRLSHLELYCSSLDKSIGEMRSDFVRDHGEADLKLEFLEKHLQEVHRSLEIWMIDLQVTDTEKELAKLQLLPQKESSSCHNSQPQSAPEPPQAYYLPPASTQYQQPQMQPQPALRHGSRPASPHVYSHYQLSSNPNHPCPEPLQNSLPMQMTSYSTNPPNGSNQPMTSYGGPPFGTQSGDGYGSPNPYKVYDKASGRVHQQQRGNFYQQQRGQRNHHHYHQHPYNSEVVDKLVSMGYPSDDVMGVIQRLDEDGQIVDFNAILDNLNRMGSQRG